MTNEDGGILLPDPVATQVVSYIRERQALRERAAMSNWARVMVCFGMDDEVRSREEVDQRVQFLLDEVPDLIHDYTLYGGGPASVSRASETVILFSANCFDVEDALAALSGMKWQRPQEVDLLFKDENMSHYELVTRAAAR